MNRTKKLEDPPALVENDMAGIRKDDSLRFGNEPPDPFGTSGGIEHHVLCTSNVEEGR